MQRIVHRASLGALLGAAVLAPDTVRGDVAHARPVDPPLVAIVIDDLGDQRASGLRAVELPGALTYAVLPHTPHGEQLARLAHLRGKEVIVHLPMETRRPRRLGVGALNSSMTRHAFSARLRAALESVPHATGASNHMGSRLTTLKRPMDWLMAELSTRPGWLFLDSRTHPETVAAARARAHGLPVASRDVFLDNVRVPARIADRLRELIATAHRTGSAVGIGHPYPETLSVLSRELPRLRARGVRLASVSRIARRRAGTRALRVSQSLESAHAVSTR